MDFTKEIPSLLTLIAFIVLNDSIGEETTFIELVDKICEEERVLAQKQ